MLIEKISKHLGVKYIYLPEKKLFLCENGVPFTLEEYRQGIDLPSEYKRRKYEGKLFDYAYAKSTGLLRKKRGYSKMGNGETVPKVSEDDTNGLQHKVSERKDTSEVRQETEGRNGNSLDRQEEKQGFSVLFIVVLLGFTSLISGYISTLHTATYLYDYVDIISAWLMSASVTAYNATAFEVSVIFKSKRRFGLDRKSVV